MKSLWALNTSSTVGIFAESVIFAESLILSTIQLFNLKKKLAKEK